MTKDLDYIYAIKNKLNALIKRNKEIDEVIDKVFDSSEEFEEFKNKNANLFKEFYDNEEEIDRLRYESMSESEKKEFDRQTELSKLKREGKL